jgi:S-DNA-T family DNA segregation ATPase FtsK/SpoIIIE
LNFASISFILFGLASYLLPIFLFLGSVFSLTNRIFSHRLFLLQMVVATTVGSALLNWWTGLQPDTALKKTTLESGGILGDILTSWMLPYLGVPGTGLILSTLFICIAILITQLNPITIITQTPAWISEFIYQWQIKHADRIKRLELERKRIEKQSRRLEQEIYRSRLVEEIPVAQQRPQPRIIDTAQPRTASEHTKPSPSTTQSETPRTSDSVPATNTREPDTTKNTTKQPSIPTDISTLYKNYHLPPITLLKQPEIPNKPASTPEELAANQQLLLETLAEFGISATRGDITRGATITRYEIYPAKGVRVDRITSLNRDIARAMKAESVNILAPVPGKDSVAIDLPNTYKTPVCLRDLIDSPYFKKSDARIPLALGKDVYGETLVADLAAMPHLLIAGTTGSGKSVCINCIILSLLYKFNPEDLRLILVDPKVVEMQCYNGLPHLVVPVVTDPKKVLLALRWVVNEMERRYEYMARLGVRNITAYNAKQQVAKMKNSTENEPSKEKSSSKSTTSDAENPDESELLKPNTTDETDPEDQIRLPEKLPYIVVIIDELADLMQTAPKDVEAAIARIAQKARAAGIHLILATQTPRAQVITGVIKTNIPCRIAFQVPSSLDSRVILDDSGAENLLGKGDMIYLPPGSSKLHRAQGAFVSDEEVQAVVTSITSRFGPCYENDAQTKIMTSSQSDSGEEEQEDEELIERCIELVIMEKKASTSLLQRKLRLGYTRAARIMDILEKRGIVGPENGAKAREVLVQNE